jgi:hypothetical protein
MRGVELGQRVHGGGEVPWTRNVGGGRWGWFSRDVGEHGAPRDGRAVEGGGLTSGSHSIARAERHAGVRPCRQGGPS